jgi:hypothetical protein
VPQPGVVVGVRQKPFEGVSMLDSFNNFEATSRHNTQYFEMAGNRKICQDGGFATETAYRPRLADLVRSWNQRCSFRNFLLRISAVRWTRLRVQFATLPLDTFRVMAHPEAIRLVPGQSLLLERVVGLGAIYGFKPANVKRGLFLCEWLAASKAKR